MADEEEYKFGYYRDHFTWSMRQAEALRKRDLDAIDWENVSEKIEDFGKGEWLDCLVSSRCRPFAEFGVAPRLVLKYNIRPGLSQAGFLVSLARSCASR